MTDDQRRQKTAREMNPHSTPSPVRPSRRRKDARSRKTGSVFSLAASPLSSKSIIHPDAKPIVCRITCTEIHTPDSFPSSQNLLEKCTTKKTAPPPPNPHPPTLPGPIFGSAASPGRVYGAAPSRAPTRLDRRESSNPSLSLSISLYVFYNQSGKKEKERHKGKTGPTGRSYDKSTG